MDCLAHFPSYYPFYTLEDCIIELGICYDMRFTDYEVYNDSDSSSL